MTGLRPTKTVFTASQFLDWQRNGTLDLSPIFQRRPVWKAPARSQLIDSLARGYPIPIILLRQVQDLNTLKTRMEVVDGQQRLRTLIAFLDSSAISNFHEANDAVIVRKTHNADLAGKPFSKLPADLKRSILDYEFSTHILPASVGDEMVFRIFARLNSTGLSLNKQELRNAEYHGAFKTMVYELSFLHLDRWRDWTVFSNDDLSRMDEAEMVSEFIITMIEGLGGKSQAKIDRFYSSYDEVFDAQAILSERFRKVMDAIDVTVGTAIAGSVFQRPPLFFSFWVAVYNYMYGLKSELSKASPRNLPAGLKENFVRIGESISDKDLPEKVQDAMDKATSDPARRRLRQQFFARELRLTEG